MFELHPKKIESIKNHADFIEFIKALQVDFSSHPEEWNNATIDSFFGAIVAWLEDTSQTNEMNQTNWAIIAKIFYMGKLYE